MKDIEMEDILSKAENKFLLVNAASARAKQISEGSLPFIDNFDPTNPVITALREIAAGKIKIKVLSGPSKKVQEIVPTDIEEDRPSALERLAKGAKESAPKKKAKK